MTNVTSKYQTTVPKNVRKALDLKPGEKVEWHVVRGVVVVEKKMTPKEALKILFSQPRMDADAVRLVHEARAEML